MSEPRWLSATELRAWAGFLETSDRLRRLVERQLREAGGLTMPQYEILHWANEHASRPLCMTELAELMISSRSGLTYQVTQLQKAGLLRRGNDPDDERRVLVAITEQGRKTMDEVAPGHVDAVREGLLDILTDDQIRQLAEIMDAARAHLRAAAPLLQPRKRNAAGAEP